MSLPFRGGKGDSAVLPLLPEALGNDLSIASSSSGGDVARISVTEHEAALLLKQDPGADSSTSM